jgi:hypothetical protein
MTRKTSAEKSDLRPYTVAYECACCRLEFSRDVYPVPVRDSRADVTLRIIRCDKCTKERRELPELPGKPIP